MEHASTVERVRDMNKLVKKLDALQCLLYTEIILYFIRSII